MALFRYYSRRERRLSIRRGAGNDRPLLLEELEGRCLPSSTGSAIVFPMYQVITPHLTGSPMLGPAANPAGLSPAQVRHAYGIDTITFPSNGTTIPGNGAGETIAIVDAYDDPSIASDLTVFDSQFGIAAPPSFIKVGIDANGNASTTSFPQADSGWAGEIELDVEWSHAIAPAANILLVEAYSPNTTTDLGNAINYARNYPGVDRGQHELGRRRVHR